MGLCTHCSVLHLINSIERFHQVYFYLQRILMLLEMEMYRVNKIVKRKQLCFSYEAKNVKHFLNEGQIYLNMANILHEHNQNMSKMFTIMLKAMDIYSKLKIQRRDEEWWINEDDSEDDYYNNEIDCPAEPFFYAGISLNESAALHGLDYNQICYAYNSFVHRQFEIMNIESLFTRIKSLCVAFTKSSSTLYVMLYFELRDYCERAKLFLCGNMRNLKSREERESSRDHCPKYDLLEKLLARVSKEQEYIARYVGIKFKKEEYIKGKSKN